MNRQITEEHHRWTRIMVAILSALGAGYVIRVFLFEDTTWIQHLVLWLSSSTGLTAGMVFVICGVVCWTLLAVVCMVYWVHGAKPMDDDTAQKFDGFFKDRHNTKEIK